MKRGMVLHWLLDCAGLQCPTPACHSSSPPARPCAPQLPSKLEQARRFAVQSRQQLEGAQRAVPPARQAVAEAQEEVGMGGLVHGNGCCRSCRCAWQR